MPRIQVQGASGSATSIAVKTANQVVNNSTTFVNDTHLRLPIAAGQSLVIQGGVFVKGSSTPDVKFTFSVPVGASTKFGFVGGATSGTGGQWFAKDTAGASLAIAGSTTEYNMVMVYAFVTNPSGAAGEVVLQWAQNVADPTDTTVYAGSWLTWREVTGPFG